MLQKNTVKRTTFQLLKEIMADEYLKDFYLVGGTNLALNMGHRESIDLDLFTPNSFSTEQLNKYLVDKYGFTETFSHRNTLKGVINDVKIDCIKYDYPLIDDIRVVEGVRMYSLLDVACMKLSAIVDNGSRLKDFIDVAYLSTKYPLQEMFEMYQKKYNKPNSIPVVKALLYFNDIIDDEPIILLNQKYHWKDIEKRLENMVKEPNKTFSTSPCKKITKQQKI